MKRILTAVLLTIATTLTTNAGDKIHKNVVKLNEPFVSVSSARKAQAKSSKVISSANALAHTYTATATTNDYGTISWTCEVTVDATNANKLWFGYLVPFCTESGQVVTNETNRFYGILSQDKTKILIPYPQSYYLDSEELVLSIINSSGYVVTSGSGDIIVSIANDGTKLTIEDQVIMYVNDGFPNNQVTYYNILNPGATLTREGGSASNVTYSNGVMTATLTTAGTLESSIANSGYSTANVTELVVTGPLNGADLKVIRNLTTTGNVTKLRLTKDGKNATIVGGDPTNYYGSYTASKDNVLPAYLFYSSKLTNIYLPNTITSIESYCFGNSKQLVDLSIPASVTSVNSSFVNGCSALTTLYVGSGSSSYDALNGVLYTKDLKTLVRYPEGLTATSFSVRSGVTAIASHAFYKAKLTSISLPTTLQSIGSSTFSYSSIKTLSIPASVTSVSTTSFSAMSALTQFTVASGNTAFSTDSRALFDKNKTLLKAYAQGNTSTTYTIPSTVTEIEYDAFWTNKYLKKITLPDNVTTIGGYAFASCSSLEEINIPAKVTKIDSYAFSSNAAMKSVTSAITSPTALSETVFNSIPSTATLYVPAGTKSKYQSLAGWNLFTNIVEQGGGGTTGNVTYSNGVMTVTMTTAGTLESSIANSGYSTANVTELVVTGPLNGADLKVIRDMCVNNNLTSLDISGANIVGGNTTKYYSDYSATDNDVLPAYLFNNSKLEDIALPSSIKEIASQVFYNCKKLTTLTIPSKVTVINDIFYGCTSLRSINVATGNTYFKSVNGVLYSYDGATLVKYPIAKTGTSYTVESSTKAIKDYAFQANTYLKSVSLLNVTSIGNYAFYGCSGIENMTIPSTVISIGYGALVKMTAMKKFVLSSGNAYFFVDSNGVLFDKGKTTLNVYPAGSTATSYTLPTTVTVIEMYAFAGASKLNDVTLPDILKTIDSYTFSGCTSMKKITIPANVEKIGSSAFSGCISLMSVTSKIVSPKSISDNVFDGLPSSATLYVPTGTKSKYQSLTGWNKFTNIVEQGGSTSPTATGNGTLSSPYNAVAATNVALGLSVGSTSSQKYYIKGKISSITYPFSSDYGTATFYISDDGTTANQFCVYGTYYLENKPWVTGNPQIAIGDDVIIYGNITNYSGTAETADKKSYVYSHNGMTSISGGVAFNNGTMTLTMTTAGTLQTAIASSGYSAASVRELVITGPINGTDIRYIRQLAGINYSNSSVTATLETLNLENANIVSGGEYYKSPSYATSDNVVGLSMFADTQLKYIFLPKSATTIMSQAFGNCKQLMGVTVYNKVTSVPNNLFNDCSALCYIDWQPTRSLTSGMLPTSSVRNPNLLLYVTSSSYAPYTTPNVVVGSTAAQVTLTNGYAFCSPRQFTATKISYSRSFTKTTGNGSALGWETITLPFQPTEISHATKGELVPFGRWSGTSDSKKPFWLYGYGSSGFTASNYLYANQPYIIAMPNNTKYDDAYRVNGTVTFSATGATVKASSQAVGSTNGVRTLRPAYETVQAASDKYAMNANGSQFITYRVVSPFEAYFTTTEANARGFIDIFDELPTGIESIPTVGTDETPENVYDLQGRKVVTPQRGIYIRNGKKVIVR